jgi:hypothetical protein
MSKHTYMNRSSFIFIWRWRLCTYIDVMFVVDVAFFQYLHNMFDVVVLVVTYSPPPWGSPSSLGPSPSEELLLLTYCFLPLQAMQMWSAIRRFR